ncbi:MULTISPECIES: TnsD family Tn7-like transposition protein [unclassified Pseudomonas]|uniref:TnsD family Tn7-like transposition protein n=1 Tax=unclassified Pseudomonas TaxID=196821 RepID=UPI000648ECBB|nr:MULTISPECIES: TnsD family Tn7-like transposition protein [unclassified Pseudomonas]POA74341.1 transposase [Pseudomonas sp. DP16D-R1]
MGLKFHFFPAVFPDETLHSVLSRYARLCGLRSCGAVFDGAQSANFFSQNVAFPCRLAELAEALPSGTGLSLAEVIKRHTLLPYYEPFLTQQQVDDANTLMAGNGEGLMLRLGLIASRLEFASRVRFCFDCIDQDMACVGVAYWHRVHQLPGVLICPHHGTLLRFLDYRWLSRNSRRMHLPDEEDVQSHSISLNIPQDLQQALHEIAQRSLWVLETDVPPLCPHAIRSVLLDSAIALELASCSGRLHLGRLARHMSAFFKAFPSSGEYSILSKSSADIPAAWVMKLLRKPRSTHHPLKFILLACALKVDMETFLRQNGPITESLNRTANTETPSRRAGNEPQPHRSRTNEYMSEASEAIWMRALSGADAKTIASETGNSVTCVYRTIRAIPDGPGRWKEARLSKQLGDRRNRFGGDYRARLAHECRDYVWLHRNDREWLSQLTQEPGKAHRPCGQQIERFKDLDLKLANEVVHCAERLRTLPGKPVLISRTKIGRELHVLSRFEKQLNKLPYCAAALAAECETLDAFHRRRLSWAERKLKLDGKPITQSSIYRTACIRKPRTGGRHSDSRMDIAL